MPYRILNWDKYQARKSRGSNPWIKLHKKLLDSPDFHGIPEVYRWQWIGLMLLADDNTGCINYSDAEIAFRLRVSEWSCKPFVGKMIEELDAIGIPVVHQTDATGCLEEKRREEKRITPLALSGPVSVCKPRKTKPHQYTPTFEMFWSEYPNKTKKPAAFRAWRKNVVDADVEKILASIRAYKTSEQWVKDGGAFIPHPSTWLNNRQWEDEVAQRKAGVQSKQQSYNGGGVYGAAFACVGCNDLGVLRIEGQWRRCTCDKARGISDADLAKANAAQGAA